MDSTPSTLTAREILAFFDAKARRRSEANRARRELARADADAISAHTATRHNPTRIWQWGSVLHHEHFTEVCDIHIALDGLTDPAELFAILGEAGNLTSYPLDIVQLEGTLPEFANTIRTKAKVVHERRTCRPRRRNPKRPRRARNSRPLPPCSTRND